MGGRPIANKYHEGKMKRTLKRELKVPELAEMEPKEISVSLYRFCIGHFGGRCVSVRACQDQFLTWWETVCREVGIASVILLYPVY